MSKCVKKESMSRGQTNVLSVGRDNSNYGDKGYKAPSFGGSTSNLSHSLSGSSAHMDGTGHGKKNRFD